MTTDVFFERENCFHPSIIPFRGKLLLIMHKMLAMDSFSVPLWCESPDGGRSWSVPEPIPTLPESGKYADFRPIQLEDESFAAIMGIVRDGAGWRSIYLFYDGKWSSPREFPLRIGADFRSACAQSAVAPDGSLIIPFFYGLGNRFLTVTGKFRREGNRLILQETGDPLDGKCGRGWYEPSVVSFAGNFYLTLRCDENCAWTAKSRDGLHWSSPGKWTFSDGTVLKTGPTQQHWMLRDGNPWLVYTRHDRCNEDCFRWRTPLYAAPFLPEKGCLDRSRETVVLPRMDYRGRPGLYGNFHVANLPDRSFVSDAALWFDRTPDRNAIDWFTTSVVITEIKNKHKVGEV